MRKITFVLLALVALACVCPVAFAGDVPDNIGEVVQRIAATVFRSADTAVIVLGVAAFAMNQLSQIWAWSADSKMAKIDRLIEGAISFAYLIKGQKLKKEKNGKLTLEEGQELSDIALGSLQKNAEKTGINLTRSLGDESQQRSRIQIVFDRMRNRAKSEGKITDVSETAATAE
jgi:hypothetical protein